MSSSFHAEKVQTAERRRKLRNVLLNEWCHLEQRVSITGKHDSRQQLEPLADVKILGKD